MPWDVATDDPVEALRAERERLGDTFVVDSGGRSYLFVFSPAGVRAFYELEESVASKGMADWRMLRRKVPPELFAGRRTLPHDLFNRTDSEVQVRSLALALERTVASLAAGDVIEVFDWTRRLGHVIGLSSWGGPELLDSGRLDDLIEALDGLDAADAFVHPERMAAIAAADHAAERRCLEVATEIIGDVVRARIEQDRAGGDLLDQVIAAWPDGAVHERVRGAAADVVLIHLASMSNLFAAIGWALVDMASRPILVDAIRSGDGALAARCAMESIRCGQRSVMLREVLEPVVVDVEAGPLTVAAGVTIATLVPLTNSSAAPGLDTYDPDRWNGRRLVPRPDLAAKELVTTFGHGRHTCPAQSFSLQAITATVAALVDRFDLALLDRDPRPVPGQVGGVARADGECRIRLDRRRRSGAVMSQDRPEPPPE